MKIVDFYHKKEIGEQESPREIIFTKRELNYIRLILKNQLKKIKVSTDKN